METPYETSLKLLSLELLFAAFAAIDALCVVHSFLGDENWPLYDEQRGALRREITSRGFRIPQYESWKQIYAAAEAEAKAQRP